MNALDGSAKQGGVTGGSLGDPGFRADYGLRYAYVVGAMYKGIGSEDLVVALGKAGLIGYFGSGGLRLERIDTAITDIQGRLGDDGCFGMNLLSEPERNDHEDRIVELYLRRRVRFVEAAAYIKLTPALVRYRLSGVKRGFHGSPVAFNRVLAKVSRPEVAAAFMHPAPPSIVADLLASNLISREAAELSAKLPMASEICVEADSGGHTDRGVALAIFPAIKALSRGFQVEKGASPIRIGAAGGIGEPCAAAAAFMLGADFILTGSINQSTVEAGMSDAVKDLLQGLGVQDTTYAPAGDMFELGAKVQVVRKGLLFPARANRLYEIYQRYDSLYDIDSATRQDIEQRFFRRSFDDVWSETKTYLEKSAPSKLPEIERSEKRRMAAVFKWYFVQASRLAMRGDSQQKSDYQIHCGPALGAFNQWTAGTPLQFWRNRRVAEVAVSLMEGAAEEINGRYASFSQPAKAN